MNPDVISEIELLTGDTEKAQRLIDIIEQEGVTLESLLLNNLDRVMSGLFPEHETDWYGQVAFLDKARDTLTLENPGALNTIARLTAHAARQDIANGLRNQIRNHTTAYNRNKGGAATKARAQSVKDKAYQDYLAWQAEPQESRPYRKALIAELMKRYGRGKSTVNAWLSDFQSR